MNHLLSKLVPGYGEYVAAEGLRSDSENGSYIISVRKAVTSYRHFKNFKRDKAYNKVLEHVSEDEGAVYLDILRQRQDGVLDAALGTLLDSDSIGNPRRYAYDGGLTVSPTTLRYLKVASDLKRLFGDRVGAKVAEIGGGYGGQALVCDFLFEPEEYHIFDLPDVNRLASKYLECFLLNGAYCTHTLNTVTPDDYDLVISNYAFSELPRTIQMAYVSKVLGRSKRGYLTMNSGLSDHAGREGAKLDLDTLKSLLPACEIFDEVPRTGEHNYILTWGHRQGATL